MILTTNTCGAVPNTAEVVHHGKSVVVGLATAALVNSAYDTCPVGQAIFAGFDGSVPVHRTAAALLACILNLYMDVLWRSMCCILENHFLLGFPAREWRSEHPWREEVDPVGESGPGVTDIGGGVGRGEDTAMLGLCWDIVPKLLNGTCCWTFCWFGLACVNPIKFACEFKQLPSIVCCKWEEPFSLLLTCLKHMPCSWQHYQSSEHCPNLCSYICGLAATAILFMLPEPAMLCM